MKLIEIESIRFQVLAAADTRECGRDSCEVIDFLLDQERHLAKSAKGFKSLFVRYSMHGRQGLTTHLFHEVDNENKIWELIKGSLRIFCFIDNDGRAVILTHGGLKRSKKVSKKDVNKAVRIKKEYIAAKAAGTLEISRKEYREHRTFLSVV
ncbi:hypothetical protein A3194_05280 [Candidatus Thiodiazotropha endoloripes]|uniref:type II toxin-antitoxin system RelE/ParE family toxin n=1 Tax=Candidatus Thiodiazotropha endoloripes TaxID=1818881 RepID=UPI00083D4029|nr:type II toxin-antitoxin system RelE/ParE family toxin [Candidatus Thiodiazotropha endoloripes]ODB94073.1 hypothetical protein A3194_05280 [Candidatus Thiodiazotropha endoloripes]